MKRRGESLPHRVPLRVNSNHPQLLPRRALLACHRTAAVDAAPQAGPSRSEWSRWSCRESSCQAKTQVLSCCPMARASAMTSCLVQEPGADTTVQVRRAWASVAAAGRRRWARCGLRHRQHPPLQDRLGAGWTKHDGQEQGLGPAAFPGPHAMDALPCMVLRRWWPAWPCRTSALEAAAAGASSPCRAAAWLLWAGERRHPHAMTRSPSPAQHRVRPMEPAPRGAGTGIDSGCTTPHAPGVMSNC